MPAALLSLFPGAAVVFEPVAFVVALVVSDLVVSAAGVLLPSSGTASVTDVWIIGGPAVVVASEAAGAALVSAPEGDAAAGSSFCILSVVAAVLLPSTLAELGVSVVLSWAHAATNKAKINANEYIARIFIFIFNFILFKLIGCLALFVGLN